MASVIALSPSRLLRKRSAPGDVLAIEHLSSTHDALATLGHGGSLYLLGAGKQDELWLVAVLEVPERAGSRVGDRRKPGWYAPANTTPITDISKLRRQLRLGGDLATALRSPRVLTPATERAIRALTGDPDAPVLAPKRAVHLARTLHAETRPIERAAAHLASSHVIEAIAALLDAWRSSRVPELADLIDRATRITPESGLPLLTKRLERRECQQAWVTAFADHETTLPQLLQNLDEGDGGTGRCQRLAGLLDDPRIATRFVRLMQQSLPYWPPRDSAPVLEVVTRARDVRTCMSLGELETELDPRPRDDATLALLEFARNPRRHFATWPLELTSEDRTQVHVIEQELHRLEAPRRTERELIEAIAEQPGDDSPSLVYADWLAERGHPRGEYLALECQRLRGGLSAAAARRLAMLVEVPYLFGAIDDLAAIRLRARAHGIDRTLDILWSTPDESWRAAAHEPLVGALETIRMIGTPAARVDAMAAFLLSTPRLRTVEGIDGRAAKLLVPRLQRRFRHGTGGKLTRVPERR